MMWTDEIDEFDLTDQSDLFCSQEKHVFFITFFRNYMHWIVKETLSQTHNSRATA